MARFNFTADDVVRTRLSPASAPVFETMLVMAELQGLVTGRHRRRVSRWLREALRAFPATARPLFELLAPCAPWPDFLDVFAPDLKEGLEEVRATPRAVLRSELSQAWQARPGRPPGWVRDLADGDRESLELLVRALHDLHDAVIAPRWDNALVAVHADVARRLPVLAAAGLAELFGTLHPRLRWQDDGLEWADTDSEYDLRGLGLILMPSAFWTGDPVVSLRGEGSDPAVLIYPAHSSDRGSAHDSLLTDPGDGDSLAALLGPTRAAVLRALAEPRGTAELAAVTGISPASASEHAKVLRDAHLIETCRDGRSVRHSLTAVGHMILGQLPGAGRPSARRG